MSTHQIKIRADLFARIESHIGMVEGMQDQLATLKWAMAHGAPDADDLFVNITNMLEAHRRSLVATGTEIREKLPVIPGRRHAC